MIYEQIDVVREDDRERLVQVWEAAVRATHDFLTEGDILFFRQFVRDGLIGQLELACVRDQDGELLAFLGVTGNRIEALFVHPEWRGSGLGKRLLLHGIDALGATEVDVNEQNEQAVAFYRRMGFAARSRSELDKAGLPFPLLRMTLAGND